MIKIYRDDEAKSIFFEDANGAQFPNSLQAILNLDDTVAVIDLARSVEIVSNETYDQFVNESDENYGADPVSTVNALNAEFVVSGTDTTNPPTITSPTSINAVDGETINYTLTAEYGVGYEWDGLPSGLVTAEGNTRKIMGSLSSGTYTPIMRAVNYNGTDSQTLTINVSNPPFANTKSINFVSNDYLNGNPLSLINTLGRVGNGSGATDAWSIGFWFKRGFHSSPSKQTILFFGDTDYNNGGHIWIYHKGNDNTVTLEYGTGNNRVVITTPASSVSGDWQYYLFTYDGGTTGVQSTEILDYYSRFQIRIDDVLQVTSNGNSNFGYSGSIPSNVFRIGKRGNQTDYMRNNCRVDEIAIWNSNQALNSALIYNLGVPLDLSSLLAPPENWWRMGDGDTYPFLADVINTSFFIMTNMTAADIVNDVP